MKKIISGSLFFLAFTLLHAQNDEEVLMRIGDRDVSRSEFEYAYNKNQAQNKKLLTDFMQSFVNLKLLALEAESKGLDTLASFRERMELLTERLKLASEENVASLSANNRQRTRVAHLFIYLPQSATSRYIRKAESKMDSIYKATSTSEELFSTCVQHYIDVPDTEVLGEIAVLPANHTMEELERKIRSLKVGELSRPFVTPAGVHLIQVLGREGEEVASESAEFSLDADREQTFLWNEWREALLQETLESEEGNMYVTSDELASFFKKNKKKYAWDLPHFKGGVLYCKDKASAKEVKALVKDLPTKLWSQAVERYNIKHSGKEVMVESGLFCIGSNPAVDKLVFGQGTFLPKTEFPYVITVGKKLKKGPKSYKDVDKLVEHDYKNFRKKEQMAALLKKYKVEINQEVLKTVNNHGGNELKAYLR